MRLFEPDRPHRSLQHNRIYALYEIAFTTVDFLAAALFITGSVLFFDKATVNAGTWLFLFGSICFALKPTIRLAREYHLWRIGDYSQLSDRVRN